MFLKYVLSQGLGELAAGNDSKNKPQSNALLRTTLRLLPHVSSEDRRPHRAGVCASRVVAPTSVFKRRPVL